MISHADLLAILHYDPATGIFTRRNTGKVTGYKMKIGYLQIRIQTVLYYAHRLAWFYVHGVWEDFIDHKDTIRDHNWIDNLRKSDRKGNNRNTSLKATNTSGYKGLCWVRGRWQVYIVVDRKQLYLGRFDDPVEAAKAYDEAAVKHHGSFARTNKMLGLLP